MSLFRSCNICNGEADADDEDSDTFVHSPASRPAVHQNAYDLAEPRNGCLRSPHATLMLHNDGGSKLTQKAFYIGNSGKSEAAVDGVVGRFGEGLNLSLAALWRAKCPIEILSDGEPWAISQYDGQLWVETPENDSSFPIGAVQYASHAMGVKEAVRELISNWIDECTLKGEEGPADFVRVDADCLEWSFPVGTLLWTTRAVDMPETGVVFCLTAVPLDAFDPRAFLRLAPPGTALQTTAGQLLLDQQHVGMVYIHGVRFDALTSPVPLVHGAARNMNATGSGFGYALESSDVQVPRDRDAMAEARLLIHLGFILLAAAEDNDYVLQLLYHILLLYPNGLESRVIRWAMKPREFSSKVKKLGIAMLGKFRQENGPEAFAVDRPLQNMDLHSLSMAGLRPVDMSQAPTLATLLFTFGGHPSLEAAITAARANAEQVAVDIQLDPKVQRSIDGAAAELGRSAGVQVHVRVVDGPLTLVRRHVTWAPPNEWRATIHWTFLDPQAIHQKLQGCPAQNREGKCSCAFVSTVKEVLSGAKDAGVLDANREQLLLLNMLALGATGEAAAPNAPAALGPQKETSKIEDIPKRHRHDRQSGRDFRTTKMPNDFVNAASSTEEVPSKPDSLCCMPAIKMQRDRTLVGPVGLFLEDKPGANDWARLHMDCIHQLQTILEAIVRVCQLRGDGVHIFVGARPTNALAFNARGSIFVNARAFAEENSVGLELADRIFGWVKHELAHNLVGPHNLAFIVELEEISNTLDADWFQSEERDALENVQASPTKANKNPACHTQ